VTIIASIDCASRPWKIKLSWDKQIQHQSKPSVLQSHLSWVLLREAQRATNLHPSLVVGMHQSNHYGNQYGGSLKT
jgi:hypothetical protein